MTRSGYARTAAAALSALLATLLPHASAGSHEPATPVALMWSRMALEAPDAVTLVASGNAITSSMLEPSSFVISKDKLD